VRLRELGERECEARIECDGAVEHLPGDPEPLRLAPAPDQIVGAAEIVGVRLRVLGRRARQRLPLLAADGEIERARDLLRDLGLHLE
jgi:hypothetical protein